MGPRWAFDVRIRTHFAHTPIRILQNTLSDSAFGFETPYEQNDCLYVRPVATSLLILLTPLARSNVRAGRLGFGRVSSVCRSFVDSGSFSDSLIRRGKEELWKQQSLFVNHPGRLWDLPPS